MPIHFSLIKFNFFDVKLGAKVVSSAVTMENVFIQVISATSGMIVVMIATNRIVVCKYLAF